MDWRNRQWDIEFCTDVLDNNLPIESIQIIPVGGRGKKLNISKDCLVFPNMRPDKAPTCGRGRRLIEYENFTPGKIGVPEVDLEDIRTLSSRMEQKRMVDKLKDDIAWPSLSSSPPSSSLSSSLASSLTSSLSSSLASSLSSSLASLSCSNVPVSQNNRPKESKNSKNKRKGQLISSTNHRTNLK